tara:strand:+ start:37 stop:1029 length:993 start_codon:yes stop_codon:yes gene_type:complete
MALSKIAREAAKKAARAARAKLTTAQKAARAKARKDAAAKKAANKVAARKPKTTQKGLRLADKPETQEGAGLDSDTGRSVNVGRDVDVGKAGKITRGKSSVNNFIKDQLSMSPGMSARTKQDDAFQRAINLADTEADKDALRAALAKIRKSRRKIDNAADDKKRRNIGTGVRAANKKPKEVDNYGIAIKQAREDGIYESEYTENLTPLQKIQVEKAARNTMKTESRRRGEAITEEKAIQSGRTKPGESGVGPRSGGERGQRVRGEERQVKDMLTTRERRGVTSLSPENEDTLRRRLNKNKGGGITKKKMGAIDYRKGGMVYSTAMKKRGK